MNACVRLVDDDAGYYYYLSEKERVMEGKGDRREEREVRKVGRGKKRREKGKECLADGGGGGGNGGLGAGTRQSSSFYPHDHVCHTLTDSL